MKRILILFFIASSCCCLSLQAQIVKDTTESTKLGLSEAEFQKAKDDYLIMTQTETYKANKKIMLDLIDKMKFNVEENIIDEKDWSKWITENLSKTKFKSVEEAIALRKLNLELTQKQIDENPELYKMISRASVQQIVKILEPENLPRRF